MRKRWPTRVTKVMKCEGQTDAGWWRNRRNVNGNEINRTNSGCSWPAGATPRRGPHQSRQYIRCPRKFFCNECITRKMFCLVNRGREYTDRNGSISWKISISIKLRLEQFSLLSSVSRYSHFKFRDLENVGQSHDVQRSQWRHATATTWLPIWWRW